jgi:hypothetical protein
MANGPTPAKGTATHSLSLTSFDMRALSYESLGEKKTLRMSNSNEQPF